MHGLHIPLGGHLLSLNQGYFLDRARVSNRWAAAQQGVEISVIVSMMKSLSVAGAKLGPMIAISAQGLLYSAGILIGGSRRAGSAVGLCFLSLWGFLQPLSEYYLMYGSDLSRAAGALATKLNEWGFESESLLWLLASVVCAKALIAMSIPWWPRSWFAKKPKVSARESGAIRLNLRNRERAVGKKLFLLELTRPFFLCSLGLMFLFFRWNGSSVAAGLVALLRPIAVALGLAYLAQASWLRGFLARRTDSWMWVQRMRALAGEAFQQTQESVQAVNWEEFMTKVGAPRRILLIGRPGSGKSSLGAVLAKELGLRLISVDSFIWKEGVKGGGIADNYLETVGQELDKDSWVLEGHFQKTEILLKQKSMAPDLVIHLSLPWPVLFFRLLKRDLVEFFLRKRKTSDFLRLLSLRDPPNSSLVEYSEVPRLFVRMV